MKNSIKTAVLGLAALVSGFSACNDADYDTLGVHAFVSESASNKSTKVTITELGADAEIYSDFTIDFGQRIMVCNV